jgi:hypothetical protein
MAAIELAARPYGKRGTTMQRPAGVFILAVLALIGGAFSIVWAMLLMGFGGLFALGGAIAGSGAAAAGGGATFFFGLVLAIDAVLYIAFAIGAFQFKQWAWVLGIIALSLSVLTHLANFTRGTNHVGDVIGLLIAGLILYYLFTPAVRAAFRRDRGTIQ